MGVHMEMEGETEAIILPNGSFSYKFREKLKTISLNEAFGMSVVLKINLYTL